MVLHQGFVIKVLDEGVVLERFKVDDHTELGMGIDERVQTGRGMGLGLGAVLLHPGGPEADDGQALSLLDSQYGGVEQHVDDQVEELGDGCWPKATRACEPHSRAPMRLGPAHPTRLPPLQT